MQSASIWEWLYIQMFQVSLKILKILYSTLLSRGSFATPPPPSRWSGKDWNKIGCSDRKFSVVISVEVITVIAVAVLSSACVSKRMWSWMTCVCVSVWCRCVADAGVLCVHVHDFVCVSSDVFAKPENTAGLLHAVALIVCLPWRTFYQTFVGKHIPIKLSAFCNQSVYACVCVCAQVFADAWRIWASCFAHCEYQKFCVNACDEINLPRL